MQYSRIVLPPPWASQTAHCPLLRGSPPLHWYWYARGCRAAWPYAWQSCPEQGAPHLNPIPDPCPFICSGACARTTGSSPPTAPAPSWATPSIPFPASIPRPPPHLIQLAHTPPADLSIKRIIIKSTYVPWCYGHTTHQYTPWNYGKHSTSDTIASRRGHRDLPADKHKVRRGGPVCSALQKGL